MADELEGDLDPHLREEIAHTTANALVRRGRASEDPQVVARLVALVETEGLDVVAAMWSDSPPDTLPGALWRLYVLREWVRRDPTTVVDRYRQGVAAAPVHEVVAGVADRPGPEDVRTVAPIVQQAGGATESDPTPKEVVARIFVAPTTDRDTVIGMGRYAIAAYLSVPVYAAFHEWMGRGEQLADMWRLWKEGDRKAALAAIPESLVDELIVWGSPEECREHIDRYVANGVTTPALALLPFGIDQRQAIRDLAPR